MKVTKTIQSVRELVNTARSQAKKVALVPTMGALHIGHISLIEAALRQCDFVVVSIFVNPIQFGPEEDFEKYPRPIDTDLEICRKAGVNVVFAPTAEQIYPDKNLTWVNVEKLTEPLCGQLRPGHFRGVATVCAKLFNIVQPDFAYFGQKDAQQTIVIKRMVADLNMPLEIIVCPTVRQPNGLAVSSRNKYLNEQQKKDATLIYESLRKSTQMIGSGIIEVQEVTNQINKILSQASAIKIEYISIVNAETLRKLRQITGKVLIAVAVKIDSTRLIDNIIVDSKK